MTIAPTPAPSGGGVPAEGAQASAPGSASATENTASSASQSPADKQVDDLLKSYRRKTKINGQDRELSVEEAYKLASLGAASNERFHSAKTLKAEAEAAIAQLKQDRISVLEKQGYSRQQVREILEQDLLKLYEEEALTPEQREAIAKDQRLKEYETKEQQAKDSADKAKQAEAAKRDFDNVKKELHSALTNSELPVSPFTMALVAQKMRGAILNDYEMSAADAVAQVESELPQLFLPMLGELAKSSPAKLEAMLGKEIVSVLREQSVKAVKEANAPFAKLSAAKQAQPASSRPAEKQKIHAPDFWKKTLHGL